MQAHITKRFIDSLPLPTKGKRTFIWDDTLAGFGLAVHSSGQRVFVLQYGHERARRRVKLGDYGALTLAQARELAQQHLARIANGADPLGEKKAQRDAQDLEVTWQAWTTQRLDEMKSEISPKWLYEVRRHLERSTSAWNKRKVADIKASDVQRLYDEIAQRGKTEANRWLAAVTRAFSVAHKRGLIPANVALAVEKKRENQPRQTVLTDDALARLYSEVNKLADPHVRMAFMLLIMTGCRRSEVLRARWQDINFDSKVWHLPETKAGRAQVVPLPDELVDLLRGLPRVGDFVIAGQRSDGSRACLKGPWQQLCKDAELDGIHLHDLRRTFGRLATRQAGLRAASKLLRHSSQRVTDSTYAPFLVDDLHQARSAVVLPLKRKAEG